MPLFEYRARTPEGETRTGVVETSSQEAALDLLQRNNLVIISLREYQKPLLAGGIFGGHISQKEIVIFSRQLSTLLEAQVPAVYALKTLIDETRKPAFKTILAEIMNDVSGGLALSQAFGKHPGAFSSFYVNLIRSGEETGKLQEIFSYLADYLERSYYLTVKARNSMIYPAFVLIAFVGVIIVMLTVVIPRLVSIFEEAGATLPIYTQIIIYMSIFLRQWGIALVVAAAAGAVFVWRWSRSGAGRLFFHRLQLRVPVFGAIYQKLFMARLADNLRTLIAGGIPIMKALAVTSDVVGNAVYQRALEQAIEAVKGGGSISSAFERIHEMPVLVTQMVKVGESSGRLEFMLGSVAKFYQKEVDSALENLVALIEPLLIVFLGVGIGILVASILVPLYNLVGTF
mgnify:CR=1 FL=1